MESLRRSFQCQTKISAIYIFYEVICTLSLLLFLVVLILHIVLTVLNKLFVKLHKE